MPRTSDRGGQQTRARIAEVASGLFLERGFEAVTVAEVARAAGVSSVTVFNHFPRKEDLFLDRAADATELLLNAVRERDPYASVLASLRSMTLRLADAADALSGLNDESLPFFRTVAGSPALIARARELLADLQRTLAHELERDDASTDVGPLLAALFLAGYSELLVRTAKARLAGTGSAAVLQNHLARLERLFDALEHGLGDCPTNGVSGGGASQRS